jgi:hypothetical protein
MRRLLLLAFTAIALVLRPVAAHATQQSVYVWAYGCPFAEARTVSVFMQNSALFGAAGRQIHVPATIASDGALEFNFSVVPGPIDIDFTVDGQNCTSGGGGLVVLPGYDRHVVILMRPSLFVADWHARKFFAGALFGFPVGVSIVVSASRNCPGEILSVTPATIDAGAYYVAYVKGPHAFLKLRSSGLDGTLYIALPDASPVDSDNQYVRRDISLLDLRTLATQKLNQNQTCITTPSGSSTRFDPRY